MKTREQLYNAVAKDIIEQMQKEIQNTEGEGDGEPGKVKQYPEQWYNNLEELLTNQMMELANKLASGNQIARANIATYEEATFVTELIEVTTNELYCGFSPMISYEPDFE